MRPTGAACSYSRTSPPTDRWERAALCRPSGLTGCAGFAAELAPRRCLATLGIWHLARLPPGPAGDAAFIHRFAEGGRRFAPTGRPAWATGGRGGAGRGDARWSLSGPLVQTIGLRAGPPQRSAGRCGEGGEAVTSSGRPPATYPSSMALATGWRWTSSIEDARQTAGWAGRVFPQQPAHGFFRRRGPNRSRRAAQGRAARWRRLWSSTAGASTRCSVRRGAARFPTSSPRR